MWQASRHLPLRTRRSRRRLHWTAGLGRTTWLGPHALILPPYYSSLEPDNAKALGQRCDLTNHINSVYPSKLRPWCLKERVCQNKTIVVKIILTLYGRFVVKSSRMSSCSEFAEEITNKLQKTSAKPRKRRKEKQILASPSGAGLCRLCRGEMSLNSLPGFEDFETSPLVDRPYTLKSRCLRLGEHQ